MNHRFQTYIIKLGGSLVVPETKKFSQVYLERFKHIIQPFIENGNRFVVIVGGGEICRWYQKEAQLLGVTDNSDLNWIGAYVTRVNAEVVNAYFKPVSEERAYYEFDKDVTFTKPILVVGAWIPGKSTNMDSVLMAKKFRSNTLINLSNIDYIYDKNPKKFPDAKPLNSITWKQYQEIISWRTNVYQNTHKAGDHIPFDPLATAEAEKIGLKVIFINGENLPNFEKVLRGEAFTGTIIQ